MRRKTSRILRTDGRGRGGFIAYIYIGVSSSIHPLFDQNQASHIYFGVGVGVVDFGFWICKVSIPFSRKGESKEERIGKGGKERMCCDTTCYDVMYLPIYLSTYLSIHPIIHPFINPPYPIIHPIIHSFTLVLLIHSFIIWARYIPLTNQKKKT